MVTGFERRGTKALVKKQIEANKKAVDSFVKKVARRSGGSVNVTTTYGGGTRTPEGESVAGSLVETSKVSTSGSVSNLKSKISSFVVGSPGSKAYQERKQAFRFASDPRASVIVRNQSGRVIAASSKVKQYQPNIIGKRLSDRNADFITAGLRGVTKREAVQEIAKQRQIPATQIKYGKIIADKIKNGKDFTFNDLRRAIYGSNIKLSDLTKQDKQYIHTKIVLLNNIKIINKRIIQLGLAVKDKPTLKTSVDQVKLLTKNSELFFNAAVNKNFKLPLGVRSDAELAFVTRGGKIIKAPPLTWGKKVDLLKFQFRNKKDWLSFVKFTAKRGFEMFLAAPARGYNKILSQRSAKVILNSFTAARSLMQLQSDVNFVIKNKNKLTAAGKKRYGKRIVSSFNEIRVKDPTYAQELKNNPDVTAALIVTGIGVTLLIPGGGAVVSALGTGIAGYSVGRFILNPTRTNLADMVLLAGGATVIKVVKVGQNLFFKVGTKKIPVTKVFDRKVLAGKNRFPTERNAKNALAAFRKTVKTNLGRKVIHATDDIFNLVKNLRKGGIKGGPAGLAGKEDIGLFVTPVGRASSYFLRVSKSLFAITGKGSRVKFRGKLPAKLKEIFSTKYSLSLNPLSGAKPPGLLILNVDDIGTIPKALIKTKGFKRSNKWLINEAKKGRAFITKRSTIGQTSELEAIIPAENRVGRFIRTSYTVFRGKTIPIYEVTVLRGSKIKSLGPTKLGKILKKLKSLVGDDIALSRSAYSSYKPGKTLSVSKLTRSLAASGKYITSSSSSLKALSSGKIPSSKGISEKLVSRKGLSSKLVSRKPSSSKISIERPTSRKDTSRKASRVKESSKKISLSKLSSKISRSAKSIKRYTKYVKVPAKYPKNYKLMKFSWKRKFPAGSVPIVNVKVKIGNSIKLLKLQTSLNRGLNFVTKIVDNKTIRSFEVILVGVAKGKDVKAVSLYKFRKKIGKNPRVLILVEKTKYAIDTPGEKRDLRIARIKKKR